MTASQRLLACFFTVAGALHFMRPREYAAIVPPSVPDPRRAVAVSGAAEIVGGLAVVPRATRPLARWWLIALLAAVFPANVHMALRPDLVAARGVRADRVPRWLLWARLPLQPLVALWVCRATA